MSVRVAFRAALAACMTLLACDEGPEAGELVGELVTGRTDTGAVAFAVTALEPNTVQEVTPACAGCEIYSVTVHEREIRGVVVGSVGAGPVIRILVSDVNEPHTYGARVLDAAATDLTPLAISEFRFDVVPP